MAEWELKDYASPYLRMAVFRRMHPDATITYKVVPIEEAFPDGHRDVEAEAVEAVLCEIILPSGAYAVGAKEIELKARRKGGAWVDIPQTTTQYVKDQTKAMGRALRDLGIPMHLSDLRALMAWIVALEGTQAQAATRTLDRETGEIIGVSDPDGDDDDPDAGTEPTAEQRAAARFQALEPTAKVEIANKAREIGITNIMRAGELADRLDALIDEVAAH